MGKYIPARSEPDLRGVPSMGVAAEIVSAAPTYSATVVQDSCWISEKVLNSSEAHALRMKRASSSVPAVGWMPSHASCSAPTARHGHGGRHGSETSIPAGGGGRATCPGTRAPPFRSARRAWLQLVPELLRRIWAACMQARDQPRPAYPHGYFAWTRLLNNLGRCREASAEPVRRGSRVSCHRLSARRRVLAAAGHPWTPVRGLRRRSTSS